MVRVFNGIKFFQYNTFMDVTKNFTLKDICPEFCICETKDGEVVRYLTKDEIIWLLS